MHWLSLCDAVVVGAGTDDRRPAVDHQARPWPAPAARDLRSVAAADAGLQGVHRCGGSDDAFCRPEHVGWRDDDGPGADRELVPRRCRRRAGGALATAAGARVLACSSRAAASRSRRFSKRGCSTGSTLPWRRSSSAAAVRRYGCDRRRNCATAPTGLPRLPDGRRRALRLRSPRLGHRRAACRHLPHPVTNAGPAKETASARGSSMGRIRARGPCLKGEPDAETPTRLAGGDAIDCDGRPGTGPDFKVPVDYFTLSNGLKVVVSEDHAAPVALVEVIYNIGFRVEPKGGPASRHLFEHMMFQGSAQVKKMEHVSLMQEAGGVVNGSTRFDYTNYFQALPANALERAIWLEADRMRSLDVSREPEEPAERGERGGAGQRAQPAARRVRMARDVGTCQYQLAQRAQLLRRPLRARGRHARRCALSSRPITPRTTPCWSSSATRPPPRCVAWRSAISVRFRGSPCPRRPTSRSRRRARRSSSRGRTSWPARRPWRPPGTCRRGCRRTSSR